MMRVAFASAASRIVLSAIGYLEECSACLFCEAGHIPTDEPQPHIEGCPLHGFDRTSDIEALKAWALELPSEDRR